MKRLLFSLCCMAVSLSIAAQAKYFKEAIKNGRQPAAFYKIENTKQKVMKEDDIIKYARENNYIMGKYTLQEVARFGDVAIAIKTFEFLPRNEFPQYVCENMCRGISYADFKSTGTAYFYSPDDRPLIKQYDDVMWTGDIQNGKVNGRGNGFKMLSETKFISFSGTFKDGLLYGEGTFRVYNRTSNGDFNILEMQTAGTKMGVAMDGMAWFTHKGLYGYVNTSGKVMIEPQYKKASDFSGGLAEVYIDDLELKIDHQGHVTDYGDNQKLAYNDLVKARKKYPQLEGATEKKLVPYVNSGIGMNELTRVNKDFPRLLKAIEPNVLKYIARNDIPFSDLILAEREFPSLASQIEARKSAHYDAACKKLDGIIQSALDAAKAEQTDASGESYVNEFLKTYKDYDARKRVDDASEMLKYYRICRALKLTSTATVRYNGTRSLCGGYMLKGIPRLEGGNEMYEIGMAKDICNETSRLGFTPFYQKCKVKLEQQQAEAERAKKRTEERYVDEKEAFERKEKERVRKLLAMTWEDVKEKINHLGEWSRGRLSDTDDNYTDHKWVSFIGLRGTHQLHERYLKGAEYYVYFEDDDRNYRRYRSEAAALMGLYLYVNGVDSKRGQMGEYEFK